jgi:outer membrane protein assembly factor BamB
VAAVERTTGRVAWRAAGASFAAVLPGAAIVARGERLAALAIRSGRILWERALPGGLPSGAVTLANGPLALAEPGAVTALDPASGRTLWRFAPPGVGRLAPAAHGGIVAAAADTGFLYGLDAAGRLAWRVRAPGPLLYAPRFTAAGCLALAEAGTGSVLLAVEPASGVRLWETALDLVPAGPPRPWGARIALGGTVAGDPIVSVLQRGGAVAWTVAPPLAGAPVLAPAGPLLAVRDAGGGLIALGSDGAARWSRAAPPGQRAPAAAEPASSRGALLVAGEGITCLDARNGEILGAIPGVAPVRLLVDEGLGIASLDADGIVNGFRLATHLSVV